MKSLKNLSIRSKLFIAIMLPLLALLYYLQINIRQELNNKESAQEIVRDVAVIEELSKAVHEIQIERGLTLVFFYSEGAEERESLNSQRESTSKIVAGLASALKAQNRTIDGFEAIDSIATIRMKVNQLKLDTESEITDYYQDIKELFIGEISNILRSSKHLTLKNQFEDHLALLYAKDFLSQIRSAIGRAITKEKFEGDEFARLASHMGKHEINFVKLEKIESPELKEFLDKKYQSPFVEQTYAIIDSALNNPAFSNFKYSYDTWWDVATNSINALKEAEDFSSNLIKEKANGELSYASANVLTNTTIAVATILLILLIVISTLRGIISSINSIKDAADRMAKGDVGVLLDIKTKDEIGALALSFNEMISVTKDFSMVADAIGKGDYSAKIKVRSEVDTLGISLDAMKHNLQRLSKENEIRTWLLTGNSELNDKMRGEKELLELSGEIIGQLTAYMQAQIGAIYLKENGHLKLCGSYAFHHRKNNVSTIALGEGFVGQAALEKKPIVFHDIPDDYIRINSGLGNAIPKNILVYPFLYEGQVKGALELGSVREFSELDMQFLQIVCDNIAIAFNASQSRDRLKQLLEETQRQAEELEVQQEELKQSNEELREKTELLEKSEAELKTQQEELQQSNEELEENANLLEDQKQILENAKMQIENKARELEASSKYKSEFLANMSHELRTPLNSILILSQILMENKSKVLQEKEMQFAANIYSSGADLLNLINEILDLSKVEAGKMELDIAEFSMEDVIDDIQGMFEEIAKDKSVGFEINAESTLRYYKLVSDKQKLGQILRNLLSNAFKFTAKEGMVKLSISRPGATTFKRNELNGRDDIITFSVTDTGIGIPQEKLAIIFEAFQQVDGTTKRKYGGTGLGLSISRELAHTLGGEIHVESQEGKGSTFTLYIPSSFDPSSIASAPRQVAIKEKPGKLIDPNTKFERVSVKDNIQDDRNAITENSRVILIMEDDATFAKVLLDFVRERQYKGIVAYQGNTGLSYARHYRPDAILLDMKLPVMDGAEVLRQLKNDPELRHIPVQVISGYDLKKEGMELGAFNFIRKPVKQEVLWEAFDKIEDFVSRKIKRLLIVEDDKQHNDAVKELIGNGDVNCFSAYSGSEAYKLMQADSFDCVILDLGLPDMTGFDLLEKIKENTELNKVPIIIYTGKDLTKDEYNRLEKTASTIVLKTVHSHDRLLDETMLFLHRVESKLPREKQNMIRKLHKTDEVLKNKKALIVDDDIRNVYSLVNALEEEGLQCITAENGKEALKTLKHHEAIDIVLMDVMMPEMDGYEATREIRKLDKFKKLPVIALTAKAMKGDREKCLSAGMSDYISKPLNVEQLVSLMRVWLYA